MGGGGEKRLAQRQQIDLALFYFFQNKESRLKEEGKYTKY
jgi:hypothetical protein